MARCRSRSGRRPCTRRGRRADAPVASAACLTREARSTARSVRLRRATHADVPALARIRARPEVHRFWRGGDDLVAAVEEDLAEPGKTAYVIEVDGEVAGRIQWQAEDRAGLPPRVDRHLRRPGAPRPRHRDRRGAHARGAPGGRARSPSHRDRSRGRQRGGDPVLQQGRIPARRRHARSTSVARTAPGTTACSWTCSPTTCWPVGRGSGVE